MNGLERAVFDCNVYFQALIAPDGPAGQTLRAAEMRRFALYASHVVLDEFQNVCARPKLASRFKLSTEQIESFVELIQSIAIVLDNVPHVFDYPRDPDDEHYIDLAVAADASLIVTRDKDLLVLQDVTTSDGERFQQRFPGISILTPTELLSRLNP
jgi:putative PIN family toxin of toxin-antitoxin system